jgi:hypothetical protein
MASSPPPDPNMPFKFWWPLIAGALAGLALRLVYSGTGDEAYTAMASGFVIFAPIAVGAVTVFVAEKIKRRTLGYQIAASAAATALFVLGSLLALIEGLICAIIILPLFTALGIVGGVLMGLVSRFTNWPRQTLGCFVLLPLLLGGVDRNIPLPDNSLNVERSVLIGAPREVVWGELMDTRAIRAEEIEHAWLFRIGVPVPLEGRLVAGPQPTRRVRMAKNVYFDELITELRDNEQVRWTYRFYPDSFPPYALDEHVIIGGRYFDVRDTAYTLTPRGAETELRMQVAFRVSTRFNWYANPVARLLLGNLIEANLDYYRLRSETRGRG